MESLHKKLEKYSDKDIYPFHMPGHKRQLDGAYKIDITEIEGFDNLNNPTGIIKEMNEKIARIYGSKKSYFTVNGSTCGNLSAISAVADNGDYIIIARNCHKSVLSAAFLRKLKVEYIIPEMLNDSIFSGISLENVKDKVESLKEKGIKPKAVVLTSPTYEGVVSDISKISEYLHSKDIPLIVDSAHGAHLHFHEAFPRDFLNVIDICIMSAHKTLPVLNQGAIVHVNSSLIDHENVRRYISMYQTSSPSYVIMDSMSCAIELLNKKELLDEYVNNLEIFYREMSNLKALSVETIRDNRDFGKIIIYTNGYMTGLELMDRLRDKYRIELEMSSRKYVLAMTSFMDTKEGFNRLKNGLESIDKEIETLNNDHNEKNKNKVLENKENLSLIYNHKKSLEFYEIKGEYESVQLEESIDRVAFDMIMAYPPGIPLIVPGEVITREDIDYIKRNISCINGIENEKIRVVPA